MNVDSTVTFAVFNDFFSCFTTFTPEDVGAAAFCTVVDEDADTGGAGEPVRDASGVMPTCKSFPCVSIIADGN